MKLQPIPPAPQGVRYTLTVPQSVLFADLSLQGSKHSAFRQAMQLDYEPRYVLIDAGGAMSWNYDNDEDFTKALLKDGSVTEGIDHFVETMERTARALSKISKTIESPELRRKSSRDDVLEDLETYWQAYKVHMTSLFTFWNAEFLLSGALTKELEKAGRQDEIKQGLARFLRPNEANYFTLERLQLQKIARRFTPQDNLTRKNASRELLEALEVHRDTYSFLLAPFNLGSPPGIESLIDRLKEAPRHKAEPSEVSSGTLDDLPPEARKLAMLAQRFTFWKTERLDMFAFADARAQSLYNEAANTLSLSLDQLFAMTSREIIESLRMGLPAVDKEILDGRKAAYCLALVDGKISFYAPSEAKTTEPIAQTGVVGSVIRGVCASVGRVSGKVRVIRSKNDLSQLREGDILVTKMTRPEYGAALDKAAAFITDEGGMMCHAAIISREMKKPCVIGTGDATKLLSPGMTVEVDADNGTVTILAA